MRDGLASAVLILAGLLTAAWAASNVWRALNWVPTGGGVGAVSIAVVPALLSFLVLLLLNWSVAQAARRHSRLAERFRRGHLWVTIGYGMWGVVSTAWFMRAYAAGADELYRVIKVIDVVDAPSLPLQTFFAASVVAFVIGHPGNATHRGVT